MKRLPTPAPILGGLAVCLVLGGIAAVPARAAAAGAAVPARAAAAGAAVEPRLAERLAAAEPGTWIRVGVTLRDAGFAPATARERRAEVATLQQRVLEALPANGFRVSRRYARLAGLAGWIRPEAFAALAEHPDVRSVYLDGVARPTLSQGVAQVGADLAQARSLTGEGVTVAVIDTGIDTNHPDLEDDLVGEQCFCSDSHPSPVIGSPCCPNGQDTQSGPGAAEDVEGHGTNVSGIVTSRGVVAPTGVAPDAGVVAIRVLGPGGAAFSDIAAGLDWVLDNRNAFADPIRVVNLSLGDGAEHGTASESPCSGSNTADAIAALDAAGVVVFASSGNEGHDAGISFPGCVAEAISVGGVYDSTFASASWCLNTSCSSTCVDSGIVQDDFVCHSNSGAILDLLAPNWRTRTSGLGGGIQHSFGGTSASSPYAAAQAALLLQADPLLSPAQLLSLLGSSGVPVTNPDNGLSFPRADVGEVATALLAVCGDGVLEGDEACDDGGTVSGDCCAADCSFEASGSPCEDGDACTTADACDGAGTCQPGAPVVCDDGEPCTDDACDPGSGCVFAPNTLPCEDGDACTTGDTCGGGSCQPGGPLDCDDGEVCTDDACDPDSGCVYSDNTAPCEDGDVCTTGDACADGSCESGAPLDCDDGDPCTAEACDAIAGCVSTPIVGCGVPTVPVASPLLHRLLAGALLAAAALGFARRRQVQAPGGRAQRERSPSEVDPVASATSAKTTFRSDPGPATSAARSSLKRLRAFVTVRLRP